MVSFKTNNVPSEQLTPRCHLPGSLRSSLQFVRSPQQLANHPHRHEPAVSCCQAPPPTINNCHTVPRDCALHPRLDQPVTNSTSGMDGKKRLLDFLKRIFISLKDYAYIDNSIVADNVDEDRNE
ncbi:PREDICTED: uncharacterized protein LOC105363844 [Ceratosolen solmsi marchali]|uniref:Uncharacterized protein LOC105363844 n=1 Tax=Ceratosolen solmsi marchali TaxID=326594 RepID=A0AAJ6YKW7_9HYME|nr:PREDICTED: uncharacterized protein LOC105363844 [Ceratosolen solmsi marchali]